MSAWWEMVLILSLAVLRGRGWPALQNQIGLDQIPTQYLCEYTSPTGLDNMWMFIILNRLHAGCSLRESLVKTESAGRGHWHGLRHPNRHSIISIFEWQHTNKVNKMFSLSPVLDPLDILSEESIKKIESCHREFKCMFGGRGLHLRMFL